MRRTVGMALVAFVAAWVLGPHAALGASDAAVQESIAKAQKWLISQANNGVWPHEDKDNMGARSCLAIYTLAYTGEDPTGPVLSAGIDAALKLQTGRIYPRAAHALAMSAVARKLEKAKSPKARAVRDALRDDVRWLTNAQGKNGGWNYLPMNAEETRIDFSNTQMAILALWQATLAGEEVPAEVWLKARDIYYNNQLQDGSWDYGDKDAPDGRHGGYGSMTAAGLASVYVIADMLDLESGCPCRSAQATTKSELYPRMDKALRWLSKEFTAESNPQLGGRWLYYWLYSAERVGIAAGYKYFGSHNWYREGTDYLLAHQNDNGSWSGSVDLISDTCFATMFLYKGRAPILFEKLDCGEKVLWNPHRRDLHNLSAYIEKTFEMPIRWQIVTLAAPLEELHDAPILYLSLETAPKFTDEEKAKLRAFTDTGGTVFVEATCGSAGVRTWFTAMAKQVWPEWPLKPLLKDHPIYADSNKLKLRPEVSGIDDGIRTRVFFTGDDISCPWQTKGLLTKEYLFQFGVNLFTYATDHRQLRGEPEDQQAPRYTSAIKGGDRATLRIARMKTESDWSAGSCYKALDALAAEVSKRAGITVKAEDAGVSPSELGDREAAFMTGQKPFIMANFEQQAVKDYLAKGGFLWAEALMGSQEFDKSFRKLAADMGWELKLIEKNAPLMTGQFTKAVGYNLVTGVRYRHALKPLRMGRLWADLEGIYLDGKLVGVYSAYDVVLASEPYEIYNCRGYLPDDATAVGANLMLYLTDR
jgi:hypothetical protein